MQSLCQNLETAQLFWEISGASAQYYGQMPQQPQYDTNANEHAATQGVGRRSRQSINTGNNSTINNSHGGNHVGQNRNDDGGGRAATGDTNMRRSRSFEEQYMLEKRGWMMMVAALFVQMAFQAALQPPTWMPADWFLQLRSYNKKHRPAPAPSIITSAPSPSPHYAPAESPAAAISLTEYQTMIVLVYVVCNTVTFATSLTILVTLLLVNKSSGMRVPVLFVVMALSSSATYVLASSHEKRFMWWVISIVAGYVLYTLLVSFWWFFAGLFSYCFVTVPRRVKTRLFLADNQK